MSDSSPMEMCSRGLRPKGLATLRSGCGGHSTEEMTKKKLERIQKDDLTPEQKHESLKKIILENLEQMKFEQRYFLQKERTLEIEIQKLRSEIVFYKAGVDTMIRSVAELTERFKHYKNIIKA